MFSLDLNVHIPGDRNTGAESDHTGWSRDRFRCRRRITRFTSGESNRIIGRRFRFVTIINVMLADDLSELEFVRWRWLKHNGRIFWWWTLIAGSNNTGFVE